MKRPRWRFRISTILLLVAIVALGLGLVVQRRDAARRERALLAECQRMRIMLMQSEDRRLFTERQLEGMTSLKEGFSQRSNALQAELNRARIALKAGE